MAQVDTDHYNKKGYDTLARFASYWYQIDILRKLDSRSILEIGVGNMFLAEYLKKRGMNIDTMDFDESLNPSICGDIRQIPIEDNTYEAVVVFEVLEHIPYEDVKKALSEVYRVSSRNVVISIPDCERVYSYNITLPKIGLIKGIITLPRRVPLVHTFNGEHYWELNKEGFSRSSFEKLLLECGFTIENTFRPLTNTYHRFYVLSK